MTTIQSELVLETEELRNVPLPPNASITDAPAFPNAREIIAAVREREIMAEGYLDMAAELADWSETALFAQTESLPDE